MNNWGEIHQNLFINIANAFNNEKINWTILRNYRELPINNNSKDVDISISYSDKDQVIELLEKVMFDNNFRFKKLIKFSFCYSYVYFNIAGKDIESIKIDLFWGLQLKGYVMATPEYIYSTSEDFGLFKGANTSLSNVFNFITPIVSNGVIREKYFEPLVKEYEKNQTDIKKWLLNVMEENMVNHLEKDLKTANLENIYSYLPKIRTSIMKKTSKKHSITLAINTIDRWYYRLYQFIYNTGGGFISFHGLDTKEKKNIIEHFNKKYAEVFIIETKAISHKYFKPNVLNYNNITNINLSDDNSDYSKKEKSYLVSLISLSYTFFDYIIGYFYNTKKEILYHKTVIYNHYIYDILSNSFKTNLKIPNSIKFLFTSITPKPTVSFYIHHIFEGKSTKNKNTSIENITLENKMFKKLENDGKFFILETSQPSDENIIKAIKKYIKKSCVKVYK